MTDLMLLFTHTSDLSIKLKHISICALTGRTDLHHANENPAADSDPDAGDQHDGIRRTASRSVQGHLVRCCSPGGFCVHILEILFQLLSVCLHSCYRVIRQLFGCEIIINKNSKYYNKSYFYFNCIKYNSTIYKYK